MAKWHYLIASVLAASSTVNAQEASSQSDTKKWQHSIEIYALALNIRGDSTIGGLPPTEVDVDPAFIMDHIDMGAMLRLEGIYDNQWGYYFDYSYMKLSGIRWLSTTRDAGNSLTVSIDIRQGVLEA